MNPRRSLLSSSAAVFVVALGLVACSAHHATDTGAASEALGEFSCATVPIQKGPLPANPTTYEGAHLDVGGRALQCWQGYSATSAADWYHGPLNDNTCPNQFILELGIPANAPARTVAREFSVNPVHMPADKATCARVQAQFAVYGEDLAGNWRVLGTKVEKAIWSDPPSFTAGCTMPLPDFTDEVPLAGLKTIRVAGEAFTLVPVKNSWGQQDMQITVSAQIHTDDCIH
jgi:hypothetical protein